METYTNHISKTSMDRFLGLSAGSPLSPQEAHAWRMKEFQQSSLNVEQKKAECYTDPMRGSILTTTTLAVGGCIAAMTLFAAICTSYNWLDGKIVASENRLAEKVEENRKAISKLGERSAKIETKLQAVDDKITRIDSNLNNISSKIEKISNSLLIVSTKIEK